MTAFREIDFLNKEGMLTRDKINLHPEFSPKFNQSIKVLFKVGTFYNNTT